MYRFFCTREFANFTVDDWINNSAWFDVKLLVDIQGPDYTTPLSNTHRMKDLFLILLATNHARKSPQHIMQNPSLSSFHAEILQIAEVGEDSKNAHGLDPF